MTATKPKIVAFIPARSGSKRLPNKNILALDGHPLLAYSIQAAIDSKVFDNVICATDSVLYAEIAHYYGAEVPFLRPDAISGDQSPDIEWIKWMLQQLAHRGRNFDIFCILRPTSPFRRPETIQRAWASFQADPQADSLRAIEKCKQHPGKMWMIQNNRMLPLMPLNIGATPWHSSQYAALPSVYAQDASLEIAHSHVALEKNSISGETIIPFISQGYEGFDVNEPEDWWLAERLLTQKLAELPKIHRPSYTMLESCSG